MEIASLEAACSLLDESSKTRQALAPVVRGGELSLDVGVERLVGANGVVTKLDPSLDPRHVVKLDEFVANVASSGVSSGGGAAENGLPGVGCIELLCVEHWNAMFDAVEGGQDSVQGANMYFWLDAGKRPV